MPRDGRSWTQITYGSVLLSVKMGMKAENVSGMPSREEKTETENKCRQRTGTGDCRGYHKCPFSGGGAGKSGSSIRLRDRDDGVATGRPPGGSRCPGSSHCVHACVDTLAALATAPSQLLSLLASWWFSTATLLKRNSTSPEQDELGRVSLTEPSRRPRGSVNPARQPSARLSLNLPSPADWPEPSRI